MGYRAQSSVIAASLLLIVGVSNLQAQSPPVKIEIKGGDIVDLVKEIARWVENAFRIHDDAARQRVRDAIPDLIKSMTLLASEKRAFADRYADCKQFEADRVFTAHFEYCNDLPGLLNKIKIEIRKLIDRLAQADSVWVAHNVELVDLTKELFVQKDRAILRAQGGLGIIDIPTKFREEADKLIETSKQLAKALPAG